jgi:hypothetical protein
MDRRRKVEFEQIRREYRVGMGTIRGVAKQLGVHRRMVRQALAHAGEAVAGLCRSFAGTNGSVVSKGRQQYTYLGEEGGSGEQS